MEMVKVQQDLDAFHVDENTVQVKQACKFYGSKKNRFCVLDHLDLTVTQGSIYALLGASGCGKTTLLNCLVGNEKLNSGKILIFGKGPREKGSISPGPNIGYMPQDNALPHELTIRETMKYFGWIAGMTTAEIKERLEMLTKLLMLPDINLRISCLSGGEQRRISFAVVLLYGPQILILDEPTVGLDPLLRDAVWNHLLELANTNSYTIILTTHYIEETRQAHRVGLMRRGYITAEAAPENLLSNFETNTLEEAFLKISITQDRPSSTGEEESRFVFRLEDDSQRPPFNPTHCEVSKPKVSSEYKKLKAMLWKQFVNMFRNIPLMLFTISGTAFSIGLFFIGYGHDPKGIAVAVVNYETSTLNCDDLHCDSANFSCNFLKLLKDNFEMSFHQTEQEAKELLDKGNIHAYIVFKSNYSLALRERLRNWKKSKSWDIKHSTIDVYRDHLAKDISYYVKKVMMEAFDKFIHAYLRSCNDSTKLLDTPFEWKKPVYGRKDLELTFMGSPAFLLLVNFSLASIVTSCSILIERNDGTFHRILAMGVGHIDILVSHMISDFSLIFCQVVSSLLVAFLIFGLPLEGSLSLVIALAVVNSFSGMSFGYAIASILQNESAVMHLLSGSLTPAILLSGTMWLREGMHPVLQVAAWFLPITQAADAIKSILHRGWGLRRFNVYIGFVNCIVWSIIFLILAIIFLRYKRH